MEKPHAEKAPLPKTSAFTDPFDMSHTQELLALSLSVAVPLWIHKLETWPWEYIATRAQECASIVAEKGDRLMFRSKTKGETAEVFNALAIGVAALSFAPGGVTAFGTHWESHHPKLVPK